MLCAVFLARLADVQHRSVTGQVVVSAGKLAPQVQLSRPTILRAVRELEAAGLLARVGDFNSTTFEWNVSALQRLAAGATALESHQKPYSAALIFGAEPRVVLAAVLSGVARRRGKNALVTAPDAEVQAFILEEVERYGAALARHPAFKDRPADIEQIARLYGDRYHDCRMPLDRWTGERAKHPLKVEFLRNARNELDRLIPERLLEERDEAERKATARAEKRAATWGPAEQAAASRRLERELRAAGGAS
jgi:hypothetical protein